MTQRLPPRGSTDVTGANTLPRTVMVNQPDTISRSYLCPSITEGFQCLRVMIFVSQLDPFGFPLRDACYLLYFQEDGSDRLPATVTSVVLGGGDSESSVKGPQPCPLISSAGQLGKHSRSPSDVCCWLHFTHRPPQQSRYPGQPAPKSARIA